MWPPVTGASLSSLWQNYIPTPADRRCSTWAKSWSFSWNHGDGHQKTNNFLSTLSHFRLLHVRTCRCHGSLVVVCVRATRQSSGVSRTHNRKTLVVLLNSFSLLPSWFREGWWDAQTSHSHCEQTTSPHIDSPLQEKGKKKRLEKYEINADAACVMWNRLDSFSAFLNNMKVTAAGNVLHLNRNFVLWTAILRANSLSCNSNRRLCGLLLPYHSNGSLHECAGTQELEQITDMALEAGRFTFLISIMETKATRGMWQPQDIVIHICLSCPGCWPLALTVLM